jgi:hypothetical protein
VSNQLSDFVEAEMMNARRLCEVIAGSSWHHGESAGRSRRDDGVGDLGASSVSADDNEDFCARRNRSLREYRFFTSGSRLLKLGDSTTRKCFSDGGQ